MNVLFFVHDMANNALGRAFSLSLLVEELGWEARVTGPSVEGIWPVLATSGFADICDVNPDRHTARRLATWADVIVCVKALPDSLRPALRTSKRFHVPAALDMDDPDIEVRRTYLKPPSRRHPLRRWRAGREDRWLGRAILRLPLAVSNPFLQAEWGGVVIPHVRRPREAPKARRDDGQVRVGFVGTPRAHKGLSILRRSVASLQGQGFTLVVTADPPTDAASWESWIGSTGFEEGLALLDAIDIVCVPSLPEVYGPHQVPVKLVDAMMAARAIVASDLAPIRWAVEDAAALVPPGSEEALTAKLASLSSEPERNSLGDRARRRALRMFTPEAVAPRFDTFLRSVVG